MRLRTFVLAGIVGTVGFAAGRMTSPGAPGQVRTQDAASPVQREGRDALASERRIELAPEVPPVLRPDPDTDDPADDGGDDGGDDVGELLAAAEQHVEERRREHSAILGRVADKRTGEPLIGATVIASSAALAGEQTAITDGQGAYELTGLPAGTYQLTFYYNDLTDARDGVAVSSLDATHLVEELDTSRGPTWIDVNESIDVSFTGTEDMDNTYIIDAE